MKNKTQNIENEGRWSEKEWGVFEQGFEEGYKIAQNIYRPAAIGIYNKDGLWIKRRIMKKV